MRPDLGGRGKRRLRPRRVAGWQRRRAHGAIAAESREGVVASPETGAGQMESEEPEHAGIQGRRERSEGAPGPQGGE